MTSDSRKVVLVTGAATGIGRAIAVRFAQQGADLMILDIDPEATATTAGLVKDAGGTCHVMGGDVGNFGDVERAVDETIRRFGRIDVGVNNAGIARVGSVADTTLEDFREMFRVNVDGVFHGCKAMLPHMLAARSGKIINIASWFGKVGKANYSAYCASKAAVIGLTQSIAMEVASHKINVNAVCPGTIVDTAMRDKADAEGLKKGMPTARQREAGIPLGRVGVPTDIARVVAFLASDDAEYMTGQALNVTGGLWMH